MGVLAQSHKNRTASMSFWMEVTDSAISLFSVSKAACGIWGLRFRWSLSDKILQIILRVPGGNVQEETVKQGLSNKHYIHYPIYQTNRQCGQICLQDCYRVQLDSGPDLRARAAGSPWSQGQYLTLLLFQNDFRCFILINADDFFHSIAVYQRSKEGSSF